MNNTLFWNVTYDTDRKGLFEEVEKRCCNFRDPNKQDKFVYLMTADTQIANTMAALCSRCGHFKRDDQGLRSINLYPYLELKPAYIHRGKIITSVYKGEQVYT